MPEPRPDPTPDIYAILDRAGLNPGGLYNTRKPMAVIVNEVRTQIAIQIAEYIHQRESISKGEKNVRAKIQIDRPNPKR